MKVVEKHLTVDEATFNKVKKLSKQTHRSMRGLITMLVEEFEKTQKGKK